MDLPIEDVQTYPRPPALEPVPQQVIVRLGGGIAAKSRNALRVLETHHAPTYYIPRADVQAALRAAPGASFCEWKGQAQYWTVIAGDVEVEAAAWSYAAPSPRFEPLRDHVAFYAARMEACFVGDERVVPQPGDFYGGWVTSNLRGRIKGAPGTRHW